MDEQERLAHLAKLLFEAARIGDVALLTEATAGGAPANLMNPSGDTLLMLAAYHGHAEAVKVLLAAGAYPDQMNDRGQTPLGGATFKGYRDVAEVLMAAGADPNGGSPSAMTMAIMFDRADLLELFGVSAPEDLTTPEGETAEGETAEGDFPGGDAAGRTAN